jgi:hypothetical protein
MRTFAVRSNTHFSKTLRYFGTWHCISFGRRTRTPTFSHVAARSDSLRSQKLFRPLDHRLRLLQGWRACSSSSPSGHLARPGIHYQYKSLHRKRKEIRLLVVEPGRDAEIIRCTIKHVFLDSSSPPYYETVSYVCGDTDARATILLHGIETSTLASSEAALRRMRLPTTQRILWIDALCISQCDVEERGHQVSMMYLIYSKTSRNLIWLDLDNDSAAEALESIEMNLDKMADDFPDPEHLDGLLCGQEFNGGTMPLALPAMLKLFENPWFSRLWIVQEASLAPTSICYCGNHEIPLLDVLRVASWVVYNWLHLEVISMSHSRNLLNGRIIFKSINERYGYPSHDIRNGMLLCLRDFVGFHTLDPKDHIHAILGLWQKFTKAAELPPLLRPDYALSVSTIFANATRLVIRECKHLPLLQLCSVKPVHGQPPAWPSWVPHFDQPWDAERHPVDWTESFNKADDETPMRSRERSDMPNALVIIGISVGEINVVHTAITQDTTALEFMTMTTAIERSRQSSQPGTPTETIETQVGTVLLGGERRITGESLETTISDREALQLYRAHKRYLEDWHEYPVASLDEGSAALEFNDSSFDFIASNRAVFHTKGGHIGLGPKDARAGDIVAILYGSQHPVVLRPLPRSGEFRLLGTSYVYGIMHGEAVRKHREMGLSDTEFCIV